MAAAGDGPARFEISGTTGELIAWHALCGQLGRTPDATLGDVLRDLHADAVPEELARRILRPTFLAS